jgi:type I restriction enzyme S subunit
MNTPELVGACGYSNEANAGVFLPDRLWQITFDELVLPQYAWRFLSSREVQSWFSTIATGSSSTMKNITKPQLKAVMMPCPDIDTQKKVIDRINAFSCSCQKTIDSLAEQISSLHELRPRLISDVVTGQIDVRNIAIPDFELVDEIDTDEESPDEEVEPSEVNEQ